MKNEIRMHLLTKERIVVPTGNRFVAALFMLWHGREPGDHEWPAPQIVGGGWAWGPQERVLLEQLWGSIGAAEIAEVLTQRLRDLTGDPQAVRTQQSIQVQASRLGLVTADLRNGITVREAWREIGSLAVVQHAIYDGSLPARKVGRLWCIPRADWEAWKARRALPPDDYVPLPSIREALGIRSDKLAEFARAGLVPKAKLCLASGDPTTRAAGAGTWWVPRGYAEELVALRRSGGKMPWPPWTKSVRPMRIWPTSLRLLKKDLEVQRPPE